MLTPALSATPSAVDTVTQAPPSVRRRGLSYLRSLSSHNQSTNTNTGANSSADLLRLSPRNFFTRSVSYQETRNNLVPLNRRRSQSHSRPPAPPETGVSLTQVVTVDASGAVEQQIARQPSRQAVETPAEEPQEDMTRSSRSSGGPSRRTENGPDTPITNRTTSGTAETTESKQGPPTIRFYPHQDTNRLGRQSLNFSPISRILPNESSIIRVGRYSEREGPPTTNPNTPSDAPVGFKSKVVSRKHCEFSFADGQWQIRDVASSSGTFLNHIRLSQPNQESRLYPIKDGDIVQLGIDFRGGEEMIFRCVKIRIECNRSWQKKPNAFNKSRHAQLRGLAKDQPSSNANDGECTICLVNCLPCQALFVAPCAHTWHYKCVRPMLEGRNSNYPQFQCPNCRAYADLDADVDVDLSEWQEDSTDLNADLNADLNMDQPDRPDTDTVEGGTQDTDGDHSMPDVNSTTNPHNDDTVAPTHTPVAGPNGTATDRTPSIISRRKQQQQQQQQQQLSPTHQSSSGSDHVSPSLSGLPMPSRPSQAEMAELLAQQRTQAGSPSPHQIIAGEGPLTPRNNAGPFVFDGSGSRTGSRRRLNAPEVRNASEAIDGID